MPAHLHAAGSLDELWALLDAWSNHMLARGLHADTIEQRESYLARFLRRTRSSPETVTEALIERFLADVAPKGSTREAYVYALRSFYRFARRRGYLDNDPAEDVRIRAPKYGPPDYYSAEEIAAILTAAGRRRPAHREHAIRLLFETGARIGSLAEVAPHDVRDGRITFRVVKNDRPYSIPLTPAAQVAVDRLLELPHRNGTLVGCHKVTLWRWFNEAATDAGLPEGRRHPHLARHTAATLLYERTQDPLLVKDYLNHADLSQIHRYARVKDQRMRGALSSSLTG